MSKFNQKDRLDNFIYYCFNILSDIMFFFLFKTKTLIGKNRIYKDIHKGERCFILATGPSLNTLSTSNISNLKGEVLFGVNSLYKSDIMNELTPSYYSLFDNLYWGEESKVFKEIKNKYGNSVPTFITDYRAKTIIEELGVEKQPIYTYSKKFPVNIMHSDVDKNMYISMNVVAGTILAAIYMGFKEIYLLGCDYNSFLTLKAGHCYNDEDEQRFYTENLGFYLKFYHLTTKFHYLIAKHAKQKKIKVINITNGSLLDAYPLKDPNIVI
jgi:hypothetical protein